MNPRVYFDGSLPAFVETVCQIWGVDALVGNAFLRDSSGRLTFVVMDNKRTGVERAKLSDIISETLESYVDTDGFCVATPEELFDPSLRDGASGVDFYLSTKSFTGEVRLIDRRVIGADWLKSPTTKTARVPRFVFASLKGGVGRSTALCVLAAHLSSIGIRVLAVDLDIEAPGIGSMLLKSESVPRFGLLDYLVEERLSHIDESFVQDMVGYSWLGGGRGVVTVLPVLGQESLNNPSNVLSKIARAYLDHSNEHDAPLRMSDRLDSLLSRLEDSGAYDVVLVDARAGLHETTPSALIGLGAQIFLFGSDQPQTFSSFSVLFSSLALLPGSGVLPKINIVQAKATGGHQARSRFAQRVQDTLIFSISPKDRPDPVLPKQVVPPGRFEVDWIQDGDPEMNDVDKFIDEGLKEKVDVLPFIIDSEAFREFDPIRYPEILSGDVYHGVYSSFLELAIDLVRVDLAEKRHGDGGH